LGLMTCRPLSNLYHSEQIALSLSINKFDVHARPAMILNLPLILS
jgi:hypothetical protein